MTLLELKDIDKRFDSGTQGLAGVSLSLPRGAFVSMLGASGCGKTTLLRLIAGLTSATGGTLRWADGKKPLLGYVPQEPSLMPWASALTNARLALDLAGVPRAQGNRRARAALEAVGLSGFEAAHPRELSGGMKMRTSLARALALEPELLLLDEPFAALDEITRLRLATDLAALWQERRFTAVFVTHSVFESVYLSDRVVVLAARPGRVFADLPVPLGDGRAESIRLSQPYAEVCDSVSRALHEAMAA